jgi:hypothetical protein
MDQHTLGEGGGAIQTREASTSTFPQATKTFGVGNISKNIFYSNEETDRNIERTSTRTGTNMTSNHKRYIDIKFVRKW